MASRLFGVFMRLTQTAEHFGLIACNIPHHDEFSFLFLWFSVKTPESTPQSRIILSCFSCEMRV